MERCGHSSGLTLAMSLLISAKTSSAGGGGGGGGGGRDMQIMLALLWV